MTDNQLITFLENLNPTDFAGIVARIPRADNYVPNGVPHLQQVYALLNYVRSSTGPGKDFLERIINELHSSKLSGATTDSFAARPVAQQAQTGPAPQGASPTRIKVLFLAANPAGTDKLNIGKEMREIEERIREAEHRDLIDVAQAWAVRSTDLQKVLLQHQPHIVHFSGHGTETEELILLDRNENAKPVSKEALTALFKVLKDNVQVVVLNACYSQPQAEAITQHIPCAIGMSKEIGDKAAILFASSFYGAIAYGRSVQDAFDLGIASLLMEGISGADKFNLVLGANINASELRPINPP